MEPILLSDIAERSSTTHLQPANPQLLETNNTHNSATDEISKNDDYRLPLHLLDEDEEIQHDNND
jgi:hypothetical protein